MPGVTAASCCAAPSITESPIAVTRAELAGGKTRAGALGVGAYTSEALDALDASEVAAAPVSGIGVADGSTAADVGASRIVVALGAATFGATRTTAAVVGVAVTAALVIWTCVRAKYDGRAGAGIRT